MLFRCVPKCWGAQDAKISDLISLRKDLRIALSMPGMGSISASTILAEIGDVRDFSSPDKLVAYCGLVPSVYQSAGKLINGHITKHGSPHIRVMIIEVAPSKVRFNIRVQRRIRVCDR
jgi:transposase